MRISSGNPLRCQTAHIHFLQRALEDGVLLLHHARLVCVEGKALATQVLVLQLLLTFVASASAFAPTGPVLRVVFGPGDGPQIVLAALAVYYTTMIPLLVGVRAAPSTWFDLVRSYGRGRAAQLRYVRARAAVPYLVAGLQIAAPAAFLGAMVGEFTGAAGGLGVLTLRASRDLDIELTWALAVIATAVSVIAYAAIGALVIAVIANGLGLLRMPAGLNLIVTGAVLILAATVDALSRLRSGGTVRT